MAFEIRLATAADEDGLAELDLATWSSLASPAPKPLPESGWTFFDDRTKPEQIHVAVSDEKIVGYVKLSREIDLPSTQHVRSIHGLAVYPHFRGFGIAKALMRVAEAKARAAPADVELVNQITYYARPCAAVKHAADSARADSVDKVMKAARADSVARADSIAKAAVAAAKAEAAAKKAEAAAKKKTKTAPKQETPKVPASDAKGAGWSAQVAAYDTQADAERLAKKLTDRGYDARITDEKPFRVRIGRYARRADAIDLVGKLKDAKIVAIVVEAEKP